MMMVSKSLPKGWENIKLADIAFITMGQSPSSKDVNDSGNGMPFLQGNAEFNSQYPAPVKWCSTPLKLADKGDVLMSVRAPVGALNMADQPYCIGRGKFQHRHRNEPRFYGGKYPFVQTGDVTVSDGRIKSYSQTLNDEGLAISKLFPRGTILITIAANIGETAIAEFDLAFPDSLIGIIVNKSMDNRFLEYYLRTRKVHLNQIATESAQKNINLETLKPYPVPVPPKEEQKSIADFLEKTEEREKKDKIIFESLQTIKSALLQVLLTGEVRVKG